MIIFHDKDGNRLAITEAEALALGYTYEHKMSEKVNPECSSMNADKLAKKVILRYAEQDIEKYRAEVEELKKQLALWKLSKSSEEIEQVPTNPTLMGGLDEPVGHFYPEGEGATVYDIKFAWKVTGTTEPIPLYTHPAKELDEQFKKGFEAGKEEGWKAHKFHHPAKTLTDAEIMESCHAYHYTCNPDYLGFAREILRKAQEADKIESLGTVNIGGVHYRNGKPEK